MNVLFTCKQQRQELSEALLVQGEMIEHDMYVQEGNVFPANNQMVDNRWEGFAP